MADPIVGILLKARDEASGAIRRVAGEVGFLSSTVQRLSTGLGVWGAISAGVVTAASAAVAAGKQFADMVERFDRLSAATGLTINELQSLEQVFIDDGLSAEDAAASAKYFAKQLGENNPLLERYGITSRNTREALLQLSAVLERTTNAGTRQALVTGLLGKASGEAAGTVARLGQTWDETRGKMGAAGVLIKDTIAPQVRALDKQLEDFALQWKGLWTGMLQASVPAALVIVKALNDVTAAMNRAEKRRPKMTSEEELRHFGALAGLPSWAFDTPPSAATTGTAPPPPPGEVDKSRIRRIEELQRVLGVTLKVATDVFETLEKIESVKKAKSIIEALGGRTDLKARKISGTPGIGEVPELFGPVDTTELQQQQRELLESLERIPEVMVDIGTTWGPVVNEILASTNILKGSFDALWFGLDAGFGDVFANITNKGQTLKGAFHTITDAIGHEFERLAARIATAFAFSAILSLFPGAGAFFQGLGIAVPTIGGGSKKSAAGLAPRAGNTYNIYALDHRDIAESILSPRGGIRRAGNLVLVSSDY